MRGLPTRHTATAQAGLGTLDALLVPDAISVSSTDPDALDEDPCASLPYYVDRHVVDQANEPTNALRSSLVASASDRSFFLHADLILLFTA